VIEVRDHPNGEHIWLADVDLGQGLKAQIVWGGAPVVRAGHMVPVAPPGARVHGKKMRRRNYRGKSSFGMLCSLAELGWDSGSKDRVALLSSSAGLSPGESLDGYADRWREIAPGDALLGV
jgi:phenylalanyl-tRNA synthetase beta chain